MIIILFIYSFIHMILIWSMSFFLFGMKNNVLYSLLNNIQLKYTFDFFD
jgi:hypothetical protein